ncbi:hypothetical protein MASR1M32_26050 [Rhodobacter sp.]
MRLSTLAAAASIALTMTLSASLPARADLVIQGRAAQALHCSAMLYMVSDELYRAGYISGADARWAQTAAVKMLAYVPGTDDQKVKAMGQRFEKLMKTRSLDGLMKEYNDTSKWCQKNFL